MRRLQMLLAVTLCAVIATSFNVPSHKTAEANGPLRNKYVKARSAWSSPWNAASRFMPQRASFTNAQIDFSHECQTPSLVYKYRLFVGPTNEYQGCGVPLGVDTYYAPPGTWVSIEMDVHPTSGMYYINIDDYDGMGGSTNIFYADSPAYNVFSFQVASGHYYYVYTHTY